ncbi:MAG: DUF2975 domain-containing protein [Vicinamibacteraceae bacterium]
MHSPSPRAVAKGLAALFTVLWWWVLVASTLLVPLMLARGLDVGVQIGPNGEGIFMAGSAAQMVLPVAFELDAGAAHVTSLDRRNSGTIEHARGTLRLTTPARAWLAVAAAAVMVGLTLWILAELAALCRSVRDRQPFTPRNAVRIRRLVLAFVLAEVSRAAVVYAAHAYVAAHFSADNLTLTASPRIDARAIVSALILLVLAEVFRTGTRLDEDQSLTV